MLTQERLKELFDYDPETGFFTNRFSRGRARADCRAGSPSGHGYRKIVIDYEKYYEHHLAWFYVYGVWPDEIDHEDHVRDHNAIGNLRPATRVENCYNANRAPGLSGLRGAYLEARTGKWFSQIKVREQLIWLGTFDSSEEAHNAFEEAAKLHHGEFYLHNRNSLNQEA